MPNFEVPLESHSDKTFHLLLTCLHLFHPTNFHILDSNRKLHKTGEILRVQKLFQAALHLAGITVDVTGRDRTATALVFRIVLKIVFDIFSNLLRKKLIKNR